MYSFPLRDVDRSGPQIHSFLIRLIYSWMSPGGGAAEKIRTIYDYFRAIYMLHTRNIYIYSDLTSLTVLTRPREIRSYREIIRLFRRKPLWGDLKNKNPSHRVRLVLVFPC